MNCQQARLRLSAFMDGELAPDNQAAIKKHLTACPACREQYEELAGLDQRLRMMPDHEPPEELFVSLMARIKHDPPKPAAPIRGIRRKIWAFLDDFAETVWPMSKSRAGSLEAFSDFPPGLLGGMYMKMIEEKV